MAITGPAEPIVAARSRFRFVMLMRASNGALCAPLDFGGCAQAANQSMVEEPGRCAMNANLPARRLRLSQRPRGTASGKRGVQLYEIDARLPRVFVYHCRVFEVLV